MGRGKLVGVSSSQLAFVRTLLFISDQLEGHKKSELYYGQDTSQGNEAHIALTQPPFYELAPVTAVTDKSLQTGTIVTDSTLGGSAQP